MDEARAWFLEAAADWVEAMEQADTLPLPDRIEALTLRLTSLYHAGQHLPLDPPSPAPPLPPPLPEVDLGAYSVYTAVVRHAVEERGLWSDLAQIHQVIRAGLRRCDEGEPDAAFAWWAHELERGWGPVALRCLAPLHEGMAAFRADRRPHARKAVQVARIVELVPPTPPPGGPPFLGIQVQPVPGGAEVLAVHPDGPAAGLLLPGDFLLSVDEEPTGDLDLEALRALLLQRSGPRRLEIYRDDTTLTVTLRPGPAPASAAPPRPEPLAGRQVSVQVLHPEGAQRASMALRVLGCQLSTEGELLHVHAPADLNDDDLRALLDAGARAGLWRPHPTRAP